MRKIFAKTVSLLIMILLINYSFAGCNATSKNSNDEVEIVIFAAKSLNNVLNTLIEMYEQSHEGVSIIASYDSSGTLMAQIEEGASCDIFFPAATKQMDELDEKGFLLEDTRKDIVNNQVCLITYKGSCTKVTGIDDINLAESLAIADGSVPVGKYTRQALVNSGILQESDDVSKIKTSEISESFGGVPINECANVGAVVAAIAEGANEVGTVYYSDTFGYEDKIEIVEVLPYELTGDVIYPAAIVKNQEASEEVVKTAMGFLDYLTSEEARKVFEEYHFDISVE